MDQLDNLKLKIMSTLLQLKNQMLYQSLRDQLAIFVDPSVNLCGIEKN